MIAALFPLLVATSGSPGSVHLVAVGDIMLGRWVGKRIEREGVYAPFRDVRPKLAKADLAFGNLECALTTQPFVVNKRIRLRANPETAKGLQWAGFDLLSLANNHAADCGEPGLVEAKSVLSRCKLSSIGPTLASVIESIKGVRIGLIAFTALPPDGLSIGEGIANAIRKLRKRVDVLVVSIHWGIEQDDQPSSAQQALARMLASLGVDLVLGHHPHVQQPIAWLTQLTGRRTLVAYSLGNFVFDARTSRERQSLILDVTLGRRGVQGFKTVPIQIDRGFPFLVPWITIRRE